MVSPFGPDTVPDEDVERHCPTTHWSSPWPVLDPTEDMGVLVAAVDDVEEAAVVAGEDELEAEEVLWLGLQAATVEAARRPRPANATDGRFNCVSPR